MSKCQACKHYYIEPDSDYPICAAVGDSLFGTHVKTENPPLCGEGYPKFEQHPKRGPNGELPDLREAFMDPKEKRERFGKKVGPRSSFRELVKGILKSSLSESAQLDLIQMALEKTHEAEDWHYPAKGDVPVCPITEVYCVWEGNPVDGLTISAVATFVDGDWLARMPQGEQKRTPPTCWRYLSPADAPREEQLEEALKKTDE